MPINQEQSLTKIHQIIKQADAIVIGAGAGMSAAAGLTYSGSRFTDHFADFIEYYGMTDMYSAGFYPFKTREEKWAYWSRHIYYNRYDVPAGEAYLDLYQLVRDKQYFVLTTNVDHQFWLAGFSPQRIFAVQGDYGQFQCVKGCHPTLYDNEATVREMLAQQRNLQIPSELVPHCPVCGGYMETHLRADAYFVEDEAWHQAAGRYEGFLQQFQDQRLIFLELGVGMNTPGIIKYPFWRMTRLWPRTQYICINQGEARAPEKIRKRSICLNEDIAAVLHRMKGGKTDESN